MGVFGSPSWHNNQNAKWENPNPNPNPDPRQIQILESEQTGQGTIVLKVKYSGCTNREGVKILVYQCDILQLGMQMGKSGLDPHFGSEEGVIYPIARFEPTARGWNDALRYCPTISPKRIP